MITIAASFCDVGTALVVLRDEKARRNGRASVVKRVRGLALENEFAAVALGFLVAFATFSLVQAVVGGLIVPLVALIIGSENLEVATFSIGDSEFGYGMVISTALVFVAAIAVAYVAAILHRRFVEDETRVCPECASSISLVAKRCPKCTAVVQPSPSRAGA